MSKKFQPLDYSRGWDDYWRDHPQGYSPQEQMINWSGQLNAMIDFFNQYFDVDLTEHVTDVMEGWYFDGRLEEIINETVFEDINSKIKDMIINVKTFGAKGDGVTDDTSTILDAFHKAIETQRFLYFPNGTYLFKKDSVPVEQITTGYYGDHIKCSSMIGENATIIIDGSIGFDTSFIDRFICQNLNFIVKNSFATDATDGLTETNIFYNETKYGQRIYQNLSFKCEVTNQNGTQRGRCAISDTVVNNSIFDNIYIENFSAGVRVFNGENFKINNITCINFQTAVYTQGNLKNYSVSNILAENTFEQSQTWIKKNHPTNPDTDFNGFDLLLCNGDNYSLFNLNAINPIERCIYSQGSNVVASKLRCVNGDGFKFVGQGYDKISKNIKVSDTLLIANEDLTGSVQQSCTHSQIYWVENIHFSDCKIITDDYEQNISRAFPLSRYSKDVVIENVDADFITRALVQANPRNEMGLTSDEYIICENLTIKNCRLKKNNRTTGSLIEFRLNDASTDALNNFILKNVKILDCYVEYGVNPDTFWYDIARINGFYAEGNRSNSKTYSTGGFYVSDPTLTKNIVLNEKNIEFTNFTVLLSTLNTVKLTRGSKLHFIRTEDKDMQEVKVQLYDQETEDPVVIKDNSFIEIKIYGDSTHTILSNLPNNYIIKITCQDGYYIGKVNGTTIADILATPPLTLTSTSAGNLIIRGDLYGKRSLTVIETVS